MQKGLRFTRKGGYDPRRYFRSFRHPRAFRPYLRSGRYDEKKSHSHPRYRAQRKGALQKEKNVLLNFVKKELLNLGAIEIESPFGMKIKVYDVERTICDIIKHKNKMDAEIFSKALKFYAMRKDKNINKLMRYAKKMNIEKKVAEYMEVLL